MLDSYDKPARTMLTSEGGFSRTTHIVKDKKTGRVPTFFIGENCEEGYRNFWINCQIHTARTMMKLADVTEREGIE